MSVYGVEIEEDDIIGRNVVHPHIITIMRTHTMICGACSALEQMRKPEQYHPFVVKHRHEDVKTFHSQLDKLRLSESTP